ncbi:hypothetical protein ABLN97_10970, partial [Mycobacterium tuberculosis]
FFHPLVCFGRTRFGKAKGSRSDIFVGGRHRFQTWVSSSREEILEVFDALHNVVSRLIGLSFDEPTTPSG